MYLNKWICSIKFSLSFGVCVCVCLCLTLAMQTNDGAFTSVCVSPCLLPSNRLLFTRCTVYRTQISIKFAHALTDRQRDALSLIWHLYPFDSRTDTLSARCYLLRILFDVALPLSISLPLCRCVCSILIAICQGSRTLCIHRVHSWLTVWLVCCCFEHSYLFFLGIIPPSSSLPLSPI